MRAGIYLRISVDHDGTQTATARQREDCTRYAEARGWTIVDEFEDVDLSAWRKGVVRPQFERLLESLQAGELDVVLAWKFDRVLRSIRDFVRLREAAETARAYLVDMHGVDTSTVSGRMVAGIMASMAEAEAENISLRVRRKHLELAQQGAPIQGGHRIFGYERGPDGTRRIVPDEAALLLEARDRVFAGEPIRRILIDWNERGVTTTKGNPWRHNSLARLLRSAALSGQREYEGRLTPGTWAPIFSPTDTMRIRAILARPRPPATERYMLTGVVRCGRCGERMYGHRNGERQRRYICPPHVGTRHCGRMARMAEPVEAVVRDCIIAALEGTDMSAYLGQSTSAVEEIAELVREDEAALEQLSRDHYTDRIIERPEYMARRAEITDRLEANRARLARETGRDVIAAVLSAGETVEAQWDAGSTDWKRTVIAALIDRVVIHPAVPGRKAFDPSKVEVVWRS